MLFIFITCILLSALFKTSISQVNKPRGVPLSHASLYLPSDGKFRCFDGTATIPFEHVNDDYCDCIGDGSDEPGTSACPNGRFYCSNIGHKSKYLPSSRVNDGICDCCDGSDEYNSEARCADYCSILGQEAKEEEQKRLQLHREGYILKGGIIQKGKVKKQEKQNKLVELKRDAEMSEALKQKKEMNKIEIEEKEKSALDIYRAAEEEVQKQRELEKKQKDEEEAVQMFNRIDKNVDEKISIDELTGHYYKNKLITEDLAKVVIGSEGSDMDLSTFLEHGWPQIKQLALGALFEPPTDEDAEGVDKHTEELEKSEVDAESGEEEDEEDESKAELETGAESTTPKYDEHTQQLIDEANKVRSEYEEADRNLRDIQREIKQIEESLGKDYGAEDEFAYMEGECYEYTDREYVYKICPFDEVTQRPKHGGSEIRLGTWSNWYNTKYDAMVYNNGQACWNGPHRQVMVKLICGLETEVIGAFEPNRCEYVMQMKTPSLCQLIEHGSKHDHDEF